MFHLVESEFETLEWMHGVHCDLKLRRTIEQKMRGLVAEHHSQDKSLEFSYVVYWYNRLSSSEITDYKRRILSKYAEKPLPLGGGCKAP